MNQEIVDRHFGVPMSEWIAMLPNEMEDDIIFLSQIIPDGRDSFDLQGAELVDFARRCFIALLESRWETLRREHR